MGSPYTWDTEPNYSQWRAAHLAGYLVYGTTAGIDCYDIEECGYGGKLMKYHEIASGCGWNMFRVGEKADHEWS